MVHLEVEAREPNHFTVIEEAHSTVGRREEVYIHSYIRIVYIYMLPDKIKGKQIF